LVVNPKRVRAYAKGLGIRAKTDRLDARVIARAGRGASTGRRGLTAPLASDGEQHFRWGDPGQAHSRRPCGGGPKGQA
jgi:transposase